MGKFILLICIVLTFSACASKTEFGRCIGAFEDKKPDLEYKISSWNTILAITFFETVFVPVVVVLDATHCPVGKK